MKPDQPIVLVTGGAKRIGKAIVEDLAANGFAVAIHSNHSHGEGEALLGSIRAQGGTGCVVEADLTKSDATRRLVADVQERLGPVQLLVNNASIFQDDGIGNLRRCGLGPSLRHPCEGAGAACQYFGSASARRPRGADRQHHRPARLAADAALFSPTRCRSRRCGRQTQTLAQALAPRIRVNAIGPGPTLENRPGTIMISKRRSTA